MKPLFLIIIVILIILSFTFIYYNNDENNNNNNKIKNINYKLEITQKNEIDYVLLIPMINISEISYEKIIQNIEIINGECKINLNNSINGVALEIQSNAKKLLLTYSIQTERYFFLTMKKNNIIIDNYEYFAYMESEVNNIINISLTLENDNLFTSGIKYYSSPLFQKLENGWNIIEIKSEAWDI